ncbi:MAG: prolyl oligopeptidase family serine peptidase [Propionibacteriaceae bacterium]
MTSTPAAQPLDFSDIAAFVDMPRITALAVRPDGGRVVVAVQEPDRHGARYTSSLWEVDPEQKRPARRLTFSRKGESAPRFAPDGTLLFTSARPDAESDEDGEPKQAIWRLPDHGEARVVADAPGGLSIHGVADDGTVLAGTSVLVGADLGTDADRRRERKQRGVSAFLHTGMPIRFWDHEVGDTSARLVLADGTADGDLRDLAPDADQSLRMARGDISPDGRTVATGWSRRARRGESLSSISVIDTATKKRRLFLRGNADVGYGMPRFSPDGRTLAVGRSTTSTSTDPGYVRLELHAVAGRGVGRAPVVVGLGDLTPSEFCWTADSDTLLVAGDLHSRGAVLAIDPRTGAVRRTLADDAVYSSLQPTADGTHLYALRSAIDEPATPVRLTLRRATAPRRLPAPGTIGRLPGTVERVSTTVDGVEVGAWLCVPREARGNRPAPLMVWIHGGPHGSYNAWSWRWCPWLAVARGYAVLLPDPAMSTGYGDAGLKRGWPRRPEVVWAEVEALTDHVLARPRLDADRTALLGASFGGFMTNWIAGHTDRFDAIVTHAGLYALDQQHATTDAAVHKTRVHGRPEDEPEWFAVSSPDRHLANNTTPILLTHGNRDYRVPVSEALRMWFDLVEGFRGRPADLPHRFLQFGSENHWVLSPAHSRIWNETVLGFCDQHVRGRTPLPDTLFTW